MRLVMAGGPRQMRVWLEAETPEETAALQACATRGEWTNGRGGEAARGSTRSLLGWVTLSRPRLARHALAHRVWLSCGLATEISMKVSSRPCGTASR